MKAMRLLAAIALSNLGLVLEPPPVPSAPDTSSDPPSFERYKELIDHFRKGGFIWTVEELGTNYLLSYVPAGASQDGWHEIDIKVEGRNLDVRARRGYWKE